MKKYAATLIASLALGLAGCGSGGEADSAPDSSADPVESSPSASAEVEPIVAKKRSDDQWWQASLCSRLDLAALGKKTGLVQLERQLGNSFDIGVPPQRSCTVGEAGNGPGTNRLEFGISVAPVSAETWQHAEAHLGKVSDGKLRSLPVGDAAFASASLAMALVGDRVVTVDTMDAFALKPKQLRAALAAGVAAADGLEVEGQQTITDCAVADEQAAALLGSEPTVRTDYHHPAFSNTVCVWATDTAGIKVWALPLPSASGRQKGSDYEQTVDIGLGGGMYITDGSVGLISWASKGDDHNVTVEFVEDQQVTPEAAIALGKALENLY